MAECSVNEIINKKERQIEKMTRDQLYEKYGIPYIPLNVARLYYCIENKLDIKYFKELIALGVDLEYTDDDHNYPLWDAVKNKNDINIIKLLKDAYYEEDITLKCDFYNPNVDCYCCELEYHPENEENFGISFNGSLKEYLHILYFSDKSYFCYFEIFNISPITDIYEIDISYNDAIIDFYKLYIKFSYIKCEKKEKNIPSADQKYSEFINYNNCKDQFLKFYINIIDSLKENNIDKFKELTSNKEYDIIKELSNNSQYIPDFICDTPLILIAIKNTIDRNFFKYIYNIYDMYLFGYYEVNWNNKDTISDLYIYKPEQVCNLVILLYNLTYNTIYQDYYNLLNIELLDNI